MLQYHKPRYYTLCWPLTNTMCTIEFFSVTALFGIFLEINKHQNIKRLSRPLTNKPQNLMGLKLGILSKWQLEMCMFYEKHRS